ncbi:MAG: eight-cysteine-cluster domain-containing protein [Candidatus Aenigmatarchaeota archaeon]
MKGYAFFVVILSSILFIIGAYLLIENYRFSVQSEFEYKISGCNEQKEAEFRSIASIINITKNDSYVVLYHKLKYVCCANLKLAIEKTNKTIKIIERNTGDICKCICDYDINAVILIGDANKIEIWGVEHANQPAELLYEMMLDKSGFCGTSTYGICQNDNDCIVGGCSGQVCQSKNEEPIITTCEWRECYDAKSYDVVCKCIDNRCKWV